MRPTTAVDVRDSIEIAGYVHSVQTHLCADESCDSTGLIVTYTIASNANTDRQGDIMFDDLRSNEEFTIRLRDLALRMYNDVSLELDSVRYQCAGSLMPHDVGLSKQRMIYLTFAIPHAAIRKAHSAFLNIKDRHFGGGLMSFTFDSKTLHNS